MQDPKYVFDTEPFFWLNYQERMYWRDIYQDKHGDFVDFLVGVSPNSNLLKFIKLTRSNSYEDEFWLGIDALIESMYAPAIFFKSVCLEYGDMGLPTEKKQASKLNLVAAHLSHPQAQWIHGNALMNSGTANNHEEQEAWGYIFKSASNGFIPAVNQLRDSGFLSNKYWNELGFKNAEYSY